MWRLAVRHARPLFLQRRIMMPRTFASTDSTEKAAPNILNPVKILESLDEVQGKLKEFGESAGLPQSLEEVQGKLQELGETIQQKVPMGITDAAAGWTGAASKGIAELMEGNSEKIIQAVVPFATAAVILSRAAGELSPAQEEKLREVLPGPAVEAIKAQIPVLPADPQLEKSQAVLERLDAIQAELAALRAEVAKTAPAEPPKAA
mmetsp:Transcript_59475/g.191374  ORF Transcript_59475/g.191374 Transcript_59475/m.191374 type:complete len:206 (+) Transcript_59475:79-696(+)